MLTRSCSVLAFLFALVIFPDLTAHANPEWTQFDEVDGIKVYKRHIPGSSLLAYKGEGEVAAPLDKLLSVSLDTLRKPEWMNRIKEARIIKHLGPDERVEYIHIHLPWPLTDRDFLYRTWVTRQGDAVKVEYESVEDPQVPEISGRIRAHVSHGQFIMGPSGKPGISHLEGEIHADPRGMIPSWMVNLYQKKMPRQSLAGLKRQVAKPNIIPYALPAQKQTP